MAHNAEIYSELNTFDVALLKLDGKINLRTDDKPLTICKPKCTNGVIIKI